MTISQPPDEVWDTFRDSVYNRMERKTGWVFFIIGAIALTSFGVYCFIMEPWTTALRKTLIAVPVMGLLVLFVSVLRQRLFVYRTDRYSQEIKR
jgi:hypothetical protein